MIMEKIEKDKVLAAVVRTFFKYFTLGIIEAYADDPNDMSVYEPKSEAVCCQTFREILSDFQRRGILCFLPHELS